MPPLNEMMVSADHDYFALSKRFLLATTGQAALTNTTALVVAVLLPKLGTASRYEWLGGAGIFAAACATVVLETRDWCDSLLAPCL